MCLSTAVGVWGYSEGKEIDRVSDFMQLVRKSVTYLRVASAVKKNKARSGERVFYAP